MSAYEFAPATKMLATSCAVCGRPLVDALSVERGVGPDCFRKYGLDDVAGLDEASRSAANRCVYEIALWRSQVLGAPEAKEVATNIDIVRRLGFEQLHATLVERLVEVVLRQVDERTLALSTPYDAGFVAMLKSTTRTYRFDFDEKEWLMPSDQPTKDAAWLAVRTFFGGKLFRGPRGVSAIPKLEA